ncbi:hypothetical protein ABIF66_004088 [Bradyrhizobium japonicum]
MEEVVGLKILDLVALQDRLIGNRLGDVRLPGARFANKQSVLASGNERQGVELEAGLTWQFGIEGKRVFYRTGYARGWPRRRVTPGPSSVIGTAWLT